MRKIKIKNSLNLQYTISLTFLLVLLVFVNLRVDYHPNSIILNADFPENFFEPLIYLNTEDQYNDIQIKSGIVRASLLAGLNDLRIDFRRKELITKEDFFLIDHFVENETLTSIWWAALPEDYIVTEDFRRILLNRSDQSASYHLFTNELEWSLVHEDGLLIAEKPPSLLTGPLSFTIVKTNTIEQIFEQEDILLGIESVIPLQENPGLIQIESIDFIHSFGRIGFDLSLLFLNAQDINTSFIVSDCGENFSFDEGSLDLHGNQTISCTLQYTGNVHDLSQQIITKVNQYSILLNIAVFLTSVFFFFGISFLFNRIKIQEKISELNFNLFFLITLTLFLLGVFLSFLGIDQFQQNLLWLSIIPFLNLVIITRLLFQPFHNITTHQKNSNLTKQEYYLLISIILFSIIALFFRLGRFDFYEDEFQVLDAAAGYLKTGQFARWDWIDESLLSSYSRAWPHTFIIAQSFRIFGISEWSARLPSVLFGIGFFVLFYFFARYFTNKKIAFLSLLSAVFFPWYLRIFRFTRMYALLIPLSLLLAYFLYRWVTGERKPNTGFLLIDNLLGKYLNFDNKYLLLSIPLLYLNYLIHVNALIIVLAFFVYVCALAVIEKQKKFIILSIVGILTGSVIVFGIRILTTSGMIDYNYMYMPRFQQFLSFFGMRRFEYLNDLLQNPFGVLAGFSLIIFMAYVLIVSNKDTVYFRKYLYLFVILTTSAIFFIFIADRVAWFFYVSHITPIALILIISGYWHLHEVHFNKPVFMVTLLLVVLVFNFGKYVPDLYYGKNNNGEFREAYQVIIDNYDYDNEVIFGQYLRTYYLQDLENVRIVSLQNNQTYQFKQFMEDLEKHQHGWITWETQKSYHIADEIVTFVERNFDKIHGTSIDDTNVEVYYFSWADFLIPEVQH